MIKKLVLTISLATASLMAWSQGGGFKYDFGEKEASFSPNPGTSSTSFLPRLANHPNKGLRIRVRTGSDGLGAFNLTKTGASFISGAGLEIVSGTSTSKLSFYNTGGHLPPKPVLILSSMTLRQDNGCLLMVFPKINKTFFKVIHQSKRLLRKYLLQFGGYWALKMK